MQGLEDQLLALVVNKERPDLEETKTQLIIQNTEFTIKLKQLEDELLYKLSTAEGDITGAEQHMDSCYVAHEVAMLANGWLLLSVECGAACRFSDMVSRVVFG
jgi:hypothetical protein